MVATAVDFCLYALLVIHLAPVTAHLISASTGMVVNFVLQRRWVFTPTRGLGASLVYSLGFSLGGIGLGAVIIYGLTAWTMLGQLPLAAKVVTIGFVFIYNYLTKKIAFGDR